MKFFTLVTQHSQTAVKMEGWGKVGEGFGVGDWGTVEKMGVPNNAIFYGIRVLTRRVDRLQFS